jgi:type II secretory pathway pseudopilin PulG
MLRRSLFRGVRRTRRSRIGGSDGFTLLELIFICAVIGLLSAIALPTVFRSRMAANETSAYGAIRTVHVAQLTYALTCGYGNYASQFPDLGHPNGDGYLGVDLTYNASPLKSGYNFILQPGQNGLSGFTDCNGAGTTTDYYVSATPVAFGNSGRRAFASNQGQTIWQDRTGIAPVEPFVVAGSVMMMEAY